MKWLPDICKPEDGVWFAGDHVSGLPGWIEGAITSGLKAAREVSAKLEPAT
jgi:monoamine oxidase